MVAVEKIVVLACVPVPCMMIFADIALGHATPGFLSPAEDELGMI